MWRETFSGDHEEGSPDIPGGPGRTDDRGDYGVMPLSVRLPGPRTIRGRVTLLVTVFATFLLVPAAVVGAVVARQAFARAAWLDARSQATLTAAEIRAGRPIGGLTSQVPGIDLIQVVSRAHQVTASSDAARGMGPLATVRPTGDSLQDVETCGHPRVGCVRLAAARIGPSADSPVVYAGRATPHGLSTGVLDLLFGAQALGLLMLASLATWKVTGRTLRPVEDIRAELAGINANNLSSRVPEPSGDDEIARLAQTVNNTLRRLERSQERTERALEQQRRFASDASHELRTPISGVRAQLEEARLHPDADGIPQLLQSTLCDVDRLEMIMTDLLLLARIGANEPVERQQVDLACLVRSGVPPCGGGPAVELRLAPRVIVEGVPAQLDRVLVNLLDNARRHAVGRVRVEVRRERDMAELTVSDDGAGIPEADRDRIFERFSRLDTARCRNRGGAGLGLAITHDIVVAHHGTLHVERSVLGGACFVVSLPLAASCPEEAGPVAARTALGGRGRKTERAFVPMTPIALTGRTDPAR
jgi:signal transduction histidine kinase